MTYRGTKLKLVKKAIFPSKEQIKKAYPNIGKYLKQSKYMYMDLSSDKRTE